MRARATFISTAPGFILASRRASISPAVSGARAQAIRTVSHSGSMWGKLRRIALIIEDRRLKRRLELGENARRDGGSEMAEKQGVHMLPSPNSR
jgi:hypothetical protein